MAKKEAIAYLRTLGSRPTGEAVQALADKYGVSLSSVYGYIREVFDAPSPPTPTADQTTQAASPPPTATKPATAGQQAPASASRPSGSGHLSPLSPQIGVRFNPINTQGMPDFGSQNQPVSQSGAPGGPTVTPPPPGAPQAAQMDPTLVAKGLVETMALVVDKYWDDDAAPDKPPGPITKEEKQMLQEAWAPFVVKYTPLIAKYAVEVNVVICSVAVFGPRYVYKQKQFKEREKAKKLMEENAARESERLHEASHAPQRVHYQERSDLEVGKAIEQRLKALR